MLRPIQCIYIAIYALTLIPWPSLITIITADLVALSFEDILTYFRVQMPKLYADDAQAAELMAVVFKNKVWYGMVWYGMVN